MKGEILKKEIIKLQKQMKIHHIDWYIIPTTDYHGSEYVHPHFRFREFLSGFTGSAGTLLVNLDAAYLWTDGRYFLQAEAELFGSEITLMKTGEPDVPGLSQFLKNHISENQTLGFDGRLISIELGQKLEKICSELNANLVWNIDLADEVWKERPKLIPSPIYRLPPEVTGHSFQEKLTALQQKMASCKTDVIILTALEEIAWLFNMRGSDIEHTPVFYSFVAITRTDYTLFAPQDMLPEDFPKNRVCRYSDINVYLSNIDSDMRVWLCKSQGSYWMLKHLCKTSKLNFNQTPIALMKAIKNNVEIKATKNAHLKDGIAVTTFIHWVKNNIGKVPMSELSASDFLKNCRKKQAGYKEPSFTTISGYNSNGAIIHYTPTVSSNATLESKGFLLVDSGGQYSDGTTDITRTIALGPLTPKMKEYYTAVLKAHIALASAEFSEGTTGADLDAVTRKPLTDLGLNYNHGTGHGVGHMLSVHEGPQNISPRGNSQQMLPGMITSNEPGVYIPGEFGIRLENEIFCVKKNNGKLGFETLTLCPFDLDAIITDKLTHTEKEWLNSYHENIVRNLSPYLDKKVASWLKATIRKI